MHCGFRLVRVYGLSADRINVGLRQNPPGLLRVWSGIVAVTAMLPMSVSHDVSAAAKPHHQKNQSGPEHEVEQCFHRGLSFLSGYQSATINITLSASFSMHRFESERHALPAAAANGKETRQPWHSVLF
jgi:hypothetical protein